VCDPVSVSREHPSLPGKACHDIHPKTQPTSVDRHGNHWKRRYGLWPTDLCEREKEIWIM